jgi:hypothetical protein
MRDVIVVAEFAERIPAALQLAIRTNRSSAVGALGHCSLAARRPDIAIARYLFDLAERIHGKPFEYQRSTMQSSQPGYFEFDPQSLELKSWSTKSTGLCLRSSDGAEQLLNIGDESLRAIGFGRYGGYANSQRFAG